MESEIRIENEQKGLKESFVKERKNMKSEEVISNKWIWT